MTSFKLVKVNLLRNRLRLGLTLGVVASAFLLFALFQAMDQGLTGSIRSDKTDLLISINHASASSALPIKYAQQIKAVSGVADVGYADWFGGYFQSPENGVPVIAVSGMDYLNANPDILLDKTSLHNWMNSPNGILISQQMAEKLNIWVGQKFALGSSIWQRADGEKYWHFIVSGIYRLREDAIVNGVNMLMHYEYLNGVKTLRKDSVGAFTIRLSDPALHQQVIDQIDSAYANSEAATKTMTLASYAQNMLAQMVNISEVVRYVMGVVFITSLGIVAANINNSLRDRRKEIALFNALGFSVPRVLTLLVAENLLLLVCGCLLGYALAYAACGVIYQQVGLFMPAFGLTWDGFLQGAGIALLFSAILSLLPLASLMSLNVAQQIKQA